MVAVYIAGGVFGEEAARREINRQLGATLSPQVAGQVQELLANLSRNTQGGVIGTLIALGAILLAATKAFVELKRVLNHALKVERVETGLRGYALKRVSAFLMIVAITVLLLASMTAGTIVMVFSQTLSGSLPLVYIWHLIAPGLTLTLLVAAVFKILPDAKMEWQDVWFGAILTGTLLVTSKYLLSLYFARTA